MNLKFHSMKQTMSESEKTGIQSSVQSLSRAFNLLDILADASGGMSITALCGATGLHKSTVHRLLAALKTHGYITQEANGIYRLTYKVCLLSRKVLNSVGIVSVAKRHLKALSIQTEETVHLAVREGNSMVFVHREDCSLKNMLGVVSSVGKYLPMHTTGVGKSLLASYPDAEVAEYWKEAEKKKINEYTIDDLDVLMADLRAARERQYAVDNEENCLGVRAMAVPLRMHGSSAVAAISIAGAKERMTDEKMAEFRDLLLRTGDDILSNMGYALD